MLKKYLNRLFELSDGRLFFARYFVNFIGLVEIVCLPLLFDSNFYTRVEFLRQLFLMAPLFILGANSGYLYCLYKEKNDFQQSLVLVSIIIGLVTGGIVRLLVGAVLPAVAIFLMIVVAAVEKVIVAQEKLIIASIYKAIISFVMLAVGVFIHVTKVEIGAIPLYSGSVIAAILLWGIVIWYHADLSDFQRRWDWRVCGREYGRLIQKGVLISIQSYILIGYFLFDRYVVNTFYNNYAAEYAIGFSFSQIVFIAINTIAFAAQQKIGVNFNSFSIYDYNRMLTSTSLLFLILYIFGMIAVYIFSGFINGYGNFQNSFAMIALLFGGYFALSSIAVIGFYRGLALMSLSIMVLLFVANAVASWVAIKLGGDYYVNLWKSGALLFLSAVLFDNRIRRGLRHL